MAWNFLIFCVLYGSRPELWSPMPVEPGDFLSIFLWDSLVPRSLQHLFNVCIFCLTTVHPLLCSGKESITQILEWQALSDYLDGLKRDYMFYWGFVNFRLFHIVYLLPSLGQEACVGREPWGEGNSGSGSEQEPQSWELSLERLEQREPAVSFCGELGTSFPRILL